MNPQISFEKKILQGLLATILLVVILIVIGVTFFDIKVVSSPGVNVDAYFSEIFICSGPKDDGTPTEPENIFKISDWKAIHVCGNIVSNREISLFSYWFYEGDPTSFVSGRTKETYQPGIFFMSLKEIMSSSSSSLDEYPKIGKYRVVISQGRIEMTEIYFEIIDD